MSFFNQYPYININDLNLDFILNAIKEMRNEVTNFVSINAIKYADPIQWNITSQYEKNTIVIDPQTGTAYISVAPVPSGVALTRDEYWTVVFDLGSFVTRAAKNFTTRYEQDTTITATFNSVAGDWLVWGDTLYVANVNITAGDSYVVDGNIRRITVEEVKNTIMQLIADNYDAIVAMIGDLGDLTTTAKNNIVAAINELVTASGSLSDRLDDEVQARQDADSALQNAINAESTARANKDSELEGDIDELQSDLNTETTNRINNDNAINTEIGNLSARVDELQSAKHIYAFITDSYGISSVSDDGSTVISRFIEVMGLTENVDITSIAAGAHGFIANGTNTFLGLLTSLHDRTEGGVTQFTSNDVTDVICVGGDNDNAQTESAILTAIETFVNQSKVYFPNAKVWIGEIGNVTATNTHSLIGRNVIPAYQKANCVGGYYLNGVEKVMLRRNNFMPDGVHPNRNGMALLGNAIKQALESEFEYTSFANVSLDISSNNDIGSTQSTVVVRAYTDGRITKILANGVLNTGTSSISIANIKLGNIPIDFLNGVTLEGINFGIGTVLFGGANRTIPCQFFISDRVLTMIPSDTVSGVTGVNLQYVTLQFPATLN